MRNAINVTFPDKEEPLYKRIIKSCPKALTNAEHMRNLAREALDATVFNHNPRKKRTE